MNRYILFSAISFGIGIFIGGYILSRHEPSPPINAITSPPAIQMPLPPGIDPAFVYAWARQLADKSEVHFKYIDKLQDERAHLAVQLDSTTDAAERSRIQKRMDELTKEIQVVVSEPSGTMTQKRMDELTKEIGRE